MVKACDEKFEAKILFSGLDSSVAGEVETALASLVRGGAKRLALDLRGSMTGPPEQAVAVGVEKHADVELLAGIGCDLAQGYAFGEPKPLDDFLTLLKRRAKGMAARNNRQAALAP